MKNIAKYLMSSSEEFSESKNIKRDINYETLKAYKKKSREEEIEKYGKSLNHNKVFKNKKQYTRKNKHKNIY